MTRCILAIVAAVGLAGVLGCESTGGRGGRCKPPPPEDRPRIRAVTLFTTHEVTEVAKDKVQETGAYAGNDKTEGGTKLGDALGLGEEVLKREHTVYRVRASYAQQVPGGLSRCCRFETLVGPAPSLNTSPQANASFHASTLTIQVGRGWTYVSGDMPYTETGVVRTSTFGSYAFGQWIARESHDARLVAVYNVGKSSTSFLRFAISGTWQSARIGPGEKLEYEAGGSSGTWRILPYDPNESFLREVTKIADAAGLTISP